jgi:hypothetical protein
MQSTIMPTLPENRNWSTLPIERTAVLAVHTVAAAMRLQDIAVLLDEDPRIDLVYCPVPDRLGEGVDQILRKWEVRRVDWDEATSTTYDLVIGASLHQLGELPAKRRFATPHGCGFNKRWPSWAWPGPDDTRPTYGLERESLLDATDQLVVHKLNLPHHDQVVTLAKQCPEAVRAQAAVIGGDPAYDRLLVSLPLRRHYRSELSVRKEQQLVAVASTWGQASLLNRHPELLLRLLDELPAKYRVILTLHPAVWFGQGPQRIRAFLRKATGAGLDVVDAGEDWRGLLAAADVIIGDHTSVSVYGAASGVPFLLSHFAGDEVDPDSVMAELAEHSPRLDAERRLPEQLDAARRARSIQHKVAGERISSVPGRSAEILRRTLYRLLELDEPDGEPRVDPVSPPKLWGTDADGW